MGDETPSVEEPQEDGLGEDPRGSQSKSSKVAKLKDPEPKKTTMYMVMGINPETYEKFQLETGDAKFFADYVRFMGDKVATINIGTSYNNVDLWEKDQV